MYMVKALGYLGLGLGASTVDDWRTFATEVVGAEVNDHGSDALRLRVDDLLWRVQIEPGEQGVRFIGWELQDAAALEAVRQRLAAEGIDLVDDPETAKDRGVRALARGVDPNGIRVEFYHGMKVLGREFVSPKGFSFVTGDLGLGHLVLGVPDLNRTTAFYQGLLGFRLSDNVEMEIGDATFLRTNARHHSLAVMELPVDKVVTHHFMLEARDLVMVGRSLDAAKALGIKIELDFGQHTNDLTTGYYMQTPSGFQLEVAMGGRLIDEDAWIVPNYDTATLWGHQSPSAV